MDPVATGQVNRIGINQQRDHRADRRRAGTRHADAISCIAVDRIVIPRPIERAEEVHLSENPVSGVAADGVVLDIHIRDDIRRSENVDTGPRITTGVARNRIPQGGRRAADGEVGHQSGQGGFDIDVSTGEINSDAVLSMAGDGVRDDRGPGQF